MTAMWIVLALCSPLILGTAYGLTIGIPAVASFWKSYEKALEPPTEEEGRNIGIGILLLAGAGGVAWLVGWWILLPLVVVAYTIYKMGHESDLADSDDPDDEDEDEL